MIEFHRLANIFPLIEGSDFDRLVESVKASNGPREGNQAPAHADVRGAA